MSISLKLRKHLEQNKIKYEIVPHKKVYTALDAAATLKARLEEIAKSLVVKADKTYYLLILSANRNVNLGKLKSILKAKKVLIPKEAELVKVFKIKPGSLTGFGSIHQLPVVVDKGFEKVRQAIFAGGSLVESVKMNVKDYIKIEQPIRHLFSEVKKIPSTWLRTGKKTIKQGIKKTKKQRSKKTRG